MWQWEVFAFGTVGAVAVQVLHWLEVSRRGRWPKYSKNAFHWVLTFAFCVISGFIAVAFFWDRDADPLLAMQLGASAPLIIRQLGAAGLPEADRHLGDSGTLYEQLIAFFRP